MTTNPEDQIIRCLRSTCARLFEELDLDTVHIVATKRAEPDGFVHTFSTGMGNVLTRAAALREACVDMGSSAFIQDRPGMTVYDEEDDD